MHICCVHIDQALHEPAFLEMAQYVSSEKQTHLHRFRKPMDATRSLVGDLIIRFILCRHYGFHNNEISYGYTALGKPYLLEHPHLHFNISHSGDWVVAVVATALVGIDIEKIAEIKTGVPSLVLTDEEHKKFQGLTETERNVLFFELWTLKESYAKATGKGLSEGLNTLSVSKDNGIIRVEKDGKLIPAYFEILECIEGYKFSLCSCAEIFFKSRERFLLNEFSKEAKTFLKD